MKDIFAFCAAFIMLFCTVPYIYDVVKGKTKPNIVSWITWSLLIGIGAAALFASHEFNAGLLLAADFTATFAVVVAGIKYGYAKLGLFDGLCQLGAIIGLILWFIFNSPEIAIIATLMIDLIGTLPTVRHSWLHPEEETSITFGLGTIATTLTILSLHDYSFLAFIYPSYLLLSNLTLYLTITFSPHRLIKSHASKHTA